MPVSLDLNYRRRALWTKDDARSVYRTLVALADVVFAGTEEAAIAVGDGTPADLASRLCGLGPAEAVIKLADAGAYALVDSQPYRLPAVPVAAVDSVGAGDGFVAGYLTPNGWRAGVRRNACRRQRPSERLPVLSPVIGKACPAATNWTC